MGFGELIPRLPRLALRLSQTIAAARDARPDLVVGIDSKAFCLRVLAALSADRRRRATHSEGTLRAAGAEAPALVQYVAPSAWAFADAPRRAARLAAIVDELLVLLPFEPALYEAAGARCTFVGHPAVADAAHERSASDGAPPLSDALDDALRSGAPRSALCLLPGSRRHEVATHLPLMLDAAERIAQHASSSGSSSGGSGGGGTGDIDDIGSSGSIGAINCLLLPAPPSVRSLVEEAVRARPAGSMRAIVCSETERHAAFSASRLALACCGTINAELALAGTPQVALYRSSPLTAFIVRQVLKPVIRHATLPNLLALRPPPATANDEVARALGAAPSGTAPIPELLFEQCTADGVARAAMRLLADPEAAAAQAVHAARALDTLAVRDAYGQPVPSATVAARALLRHLPQPAHVEDHDRG
jgi:lipid-A-disaccharide synthase